jgi:hypothetical protein
MSKHDGLVGRPDEDDICEGWAESAAGHLCHPADQSAAVRLLASAFKRSRAQAITDLTARVAELEAALRDAGAHLVAAVSLLERGGKAAKKAAPSDKMFDQMVRDYKASAARVRKALEGGAPC